MQIPHTKTPNPRLSCKPNLAGKERKRVRKAVLRWVKQARVINTGYIFAVRAVDLKHLENSY